MDHDRRTDIGRQDIVEPDMLCRPLFFARSDEGDIREKSPWGGRPINNMRWIPVRAVLGECWWHQPLSTIRRKARWNYEVIKGAPHLFSGD